MDLIVGYKSWKEKIYSGPRSIFKKTLDEFTIFSINNSLFLFDNKKAWDEFIILFKTYSLLKLLLQEYIQYMKSRKCFFQHVCI